ncbi:hypothetical protein [Kitasatospora sp. NPDC088346]
MRAGVPGQVGDHTEGFEVRYQDVARLSPVGRHHVNMLGWSSFQLP